MARETTAATLDRSNPQSRLATGLLELFREMMVMDPEYVVRLKRHYDLFRKTLKQARS